jgi:mono/diheme cytochrome c family protein
MAGLLVGCSTPPPPEAGERGQVAWGATIYRLECSHCHNPGRSGPTLTAQQLADYGNAQALYEYVRTEMPLDKPGALPNQDYWDVTAFLLANQWMLPGEIRLTPGNAEEVRFERQ